MGIQRKGIPGLSADNRRCLIHRPLQGRSYHEAHRDSRLGKNFERPQINSRRHLWCRSVNSPHTVRLAEFIFLATCVHLIRSFKKSTTLNTEQVPQAKLVHNCPPEEPIHGRGD